MDTSFHATTICAIRHNGKGAIAGDGQVTFGNSMIMKNTAKKVRRLYRGQVIAGFAGSVADAITLFEKFEGKLKELVEMLPEEQKEVVILRHFFNFSFKEVAEYTKSPLNTCLGRMRYALINLRRLMEEHNIAYKA